MVNTWMIHFYGDFNATKEDYIIINIIPTAIKELI